MTSDWSVPLADVLVDEEITAAAQRAVASGWWSMGPEVAAFEEEFANFCRAPHALAVANGTAALQLAVLACGCGPGDEVIVPSLNFVAAANAIEHTGATPVFCDVRGADDLNLDPAHVEELVSPRTKAVLVLHYGGYPCDMDAVRATAERHNLFVIEDAAHAPGATWRGEFCGTLADVGCFSFFSNKNLPIGEGGMLVTRNPDLADRLRLLRSHGMTTLTWDRHRGHAHAYDVVVPGFNVRLDEIRAAIGRVQLRRLDDVNAARGRIVGSYRELLADVAAIEFPFAARDDRSTASYHLAVALLPDAETRERARDSLRRAGIQTSVHYPPIHQFSVYADREERALPRTEDVGGRLLTLPLFAHMTDIQVAAVAEALRSALATPRPGVLQTSST